VIVVVGILASGALSPAAWAEEPLPCGHPLPSGRGYRRRESDSQSRRAVAIEDSRDGFVAAWRSMKRLEPRWCASRPGRIDSTSASEISAAGRLRACLEKELTRFLTERDASEADLDRMVEDRVFLKAIDERQIRSWVSLR
jgi:hypothetical protein